MRNTLLNAGIALRLTKKSPTISIGTTTTKVVASAPPIIYAIVIENINMSGLRIAVRITIIYANCTFEMSVVIRVTSDDDENLSIFSNEKV